MSDWEVVLGPYRWRPSTEVRDANGKVVGRVFHDWPATGQHIFEPAVAGEACKVGNDGWVTVPGRKEPLVGKVFEPSAWRTDPSSRLGKLVESGEGDDAKSIGWVVTGKDGTTEFVPFGEGQTAHVDADGTVHAYGPPNTTWKDTVVGKTDTPKSDPPEAEIPKALAPETAPETSRVSAASSSAPASGSPASRSPSVRSSPTRSTRARTRLRNPRRSTRAGIRSARRRLATTPRRRRRRPRRRRRTWCVNRPSSSRPWSRRRFRPRRRRARSRSPRPCRS